MTAKRRFRLALLGMLVAAGALRLAGAFGELWLDEIWSLQIAKNLDDPRHILRLHTDNNHPLNTLWLHFAPTDASPVVHRLPAWIASLLALGLAGSIARREHAPPGADAAAQRIGRAAALLAVGALGFSHFFVLYGAEARGYAFAVTFVLASAAAAQRGLDRRFSGWAPVHFLAIGLALLSHPLAVHGLAAVAAWSAVHLLRRRRLGEALVELAWWNGLPLAFAAAYYWSFLSRLTVAGGPREPLSVVLRSAAAWTTGLPHAVDGLALAVVGAAGLAGIAWLARRGHDAWAFYAVGVFGAPALLIGWLQPDLLFARYFLMNCALWLLLVSIVLAPWVAHPAGRRALAVLAAAFLVANGARSAQLVRLGRGDHAAALRYLAEHTPGPEVRFVSDRTQRLALVLDYHAARIPGKRWLRLEEFPQAGAPWLFFHRFSEQERPEPRLEDRYGNRYRAERDWPYAGLSGWHLFLYRQEAPPPP